MKSLTYIIRAILPIYAIQYILMYLLGFDEKAQWYIYDFGNALVKFLFALYIVLLFKYQTYHYERQKNKRVVMGILVFEAYDLLGEAIGINQKGNLFEVIFGILLVLLLTKNFKR